MALGERLVEPLDCPEALLAYPGEIGTVPGVAGGFLCFPATAAGGVLRVPLGSTAFEVEYRAAFAARPELGLAPDDEGPAARHTSDVLDAAAEERDVACAGPGRSRRHVGRRRHTDVGDGPRHSDRGA